MRKNVIIFGTSGFAKLAHWYLKHDSDYTVCGFVVDDQYFEKALYDGLQVVKWSDVHDVFPAHRFSLFAPMSPSNMNKDRAGIWTRGVNEGYKFISYISTKATVLTDQIGDNCFILEDNTLQPFTKIGSNTILWSGNHIGHDSVIGESVFIASQVVISGRCNVHDNSYLGVNSTLRDGLTLAPGTFLAMASALTRDVEEPWGTYRGVPAKRLSVASYEQKL